MLRPDLASAIAAAEEVVAAGPRKTGQVAAQETVVEARPAGAGDPPVS
jgi:hypothetical protein